MDDRIIGTAFRAHLDDGTCVWVHYCPDFGTVSVGHDGRWMAIRECSRRALRQHVQKVTKRRVTKLYAA